MTDTSNDPKVQEKKPELNRAGKRRQARFRPKPEAQMKVEASHEAGAEMRRRTIAKRQEAAHVRAMIRKVEQPIRITNAQRKEAEARQRRIEARKKRHAAYLRKHPKA